MHEACVMYKLFYIFKWHIYYTTFLTISVLYFVIIINTRMPFIRKVLRIVIKYKLVLKVECMCACVCVCACVYIFATLRFLFCRKKHISFFLLSFLSRVNPTSNENLGFSRCFMRALKATRKMLQATFVSASWKLVPSFPNENAISAFSGRRKRPTECA